MAPGYSNLFSPAWLTLSGLLVGISIADLLSLTPCAHPKRRAGKARPDILCHLDLKPCHPSRRQGDLRWWKEIAGRSPQASSPAKLLPDSHQEAGGGFTGNLYSAKLMPAYWSRNGIAMSSVARHQPHGTALDGYAQTLAADANCGWSRADLRLHNRGLREWHVLVEENGQKTARAPL